MITKTSFVISALVLFYFGECFSQTPSEMLYLAVKREIIHYVNCEIFGMAECEMKFATFA